MPICLFLGLKALGVIRYFVWLDFSFDLSGAKLGKNVLKQRHERKISIFAPELHAQPSRKWNKTHTKAYQWN